MLSFGGIFIFCCISLNKWPERTCFFLLLRFSIYFSKDKLTALDLVSALGGGSGLACPTQAPNLDFKSSLGLALMGTCWFSTIKISCGRERSPLGSEASATRK